MNISLPTSFNYRVFRESLSSTLNIMRYIFDDMNLSPFVGRLKSAYVGRFVKS